MDQEGPSQYKRYWKESIEVKIPSGVKVLIHNMVEWFANDDINYDLSLMAAAPDLVRELALKVLEDYEEHMQVCQESGDRPLFKTDVLAMEAFFTYAPVIRSVNVIIKALQCDPEDLTLENLKIIAEIKE
jgi:hypothetical protein